MSTNSTSVHCLMERLWTLPRDHEVDILEVLYTILVGAQWLSGRVLDSRQRGRGVESHWGHCVVFFEQDKFILA